MPILLTIIELLHLCAERLLRWFHVPAHPRRSHKFPQPVDVGKHRHSSRKPEWLKAEILRLKALMPQAGCRSIADICNRRFAASRNITVGKTCVHYILQRHEYEIQILRRNLKHARPKAVPPNRIWGIDLTGKTDAQGKLHLLLGILDHGSRALLYLQVLHDKTTATILDYLRQSICIHGKPRIIRTDNEGMFRSMAFSLALKKLGIRHQRTTPGCPWQNGRIERLFGTLKHKLDQWVVTGIEQLNVDLIAFRYWYNHIRPHQNLGGRTPAEAWNRIDPYTKSPKQEHWFEAWDGLLTGYDLRY